MGKPLDFIQQSFIGGLNQQIDSTAISDNEYTLLINGRNRYDDIVPINLPEEIVDPVFAGLKRQGIYAAGNIEFIFAGGKAFYKDWNFPNSPYLNIPGLQLSTTVDIIYAELVPNSSMHFKRVMSESDNVKAPIQYSALIDGSPQCLVVQDGVNQPWIINTNLTARVTKNYQEWKNTDEGREYVPIGRQMLHHDGILYLVSSDGRKFLRSITGRPLDFMVNIQSDGDKYPNEIDGGADTVSHSVDYEEIMTLGRLNSDNGAFYVSTRKNSYAVIPEFAVEDMIFGEPIFSNQFLFSAGSISPFGFIELLGDYAFADFNGLRSFNAIQNFKNEGQNSPFSKKLGPILQGIQQDYVAAINFDNYALFAVKTIFGRGIVVYDTLHNVFAAIDIYSNITQIKQFAEVKTDTARRLFFITTDDKHYEAFASDDKATCQIYFKEWSSEDPSFDIKPSIFKAVFTDIKESGTVAAAIYTDRKLKVSQSLSLEQTEELDEPSPSNIPFNSSDKDLVRTLSFDIQRANTGWKIGCLLSWNFDATLSSVKLLSSAEQSINTTESAAKSYVRNKTLLS